MSEWQPIETAPRDSTHIIVAYRDASGDWRVMEAWWAMPHEDAPLDRCWWQTMTGALLSTDVHTSQRGGRLGATHWMPLPDPPVASSGVQKQEAEEDSSETLGNA